MRNLITHRLFQKRPRLLTVAAIAVALVYGGSLLWLLLSDGRLAGEPVVRLLLVPPETETAQATIPDMEPAPSGIVTVPDGEGIDSDSLSEDEQALLDAAASLDGEQSADGVRITGAQAPDAGAGEKKPLSPVPDPALTEKTQQGTLPVIGKSGAEAWRIYARPLPKALPGGPRIAIIVSGMGISESATQHAIDTLPSEVTLSFAPYGGQLQKWIAKARDAGHEVLLEVPMEPFGYPQNDPGPYTLLTSLQPAENIKRLEWLMSRFTGYAGVMNYQGARFSTSQSSLLPVLAALKSRGLMYVDNGASARSLSPQIARDLRIPFAQASRMIDPVQNPDVIASSLATLEKTAKANGAALGVASAFPITVDELGDWTKSLRSKGFVLVPASSLPSTPPKKSAP
jgi:polysaccharide deacetylase 2 family uncharacterized protein YibQ